MEFIKRLFGLVQEDNNDIYQSFLDDYLHSDDFKFWLELTGREQDDVKFMIFCEDEDEDDYDFLQLEVLKFNLFNYLRVNGYLDTLIDKYCKYVFIDEYNDINDDKFKKELSVFYEKKAVEIIFYINNNVDKKFLTPETKHYFIPDSFVKMSKEDQDDCKYWIIALINMIVSKIVVSQT